MSTEFTRMAKFILAASSGLMLGLSFPPMPTSGFAFTAFLPFLFLLERLKSYAEVFRWSYVTFLFFNLSTVYWISGWWGNDPWLKVAGIAVNCVHPLLFTIPALVFHLVRKRIPGNGSLFLFPFIWTAYEWAAHLPELSFPWLVMGNSQALEFSSIQFISFTGVFGVSFWILMSNVLLFLIMRSILTKGREWRFKDAGTLILVWIAIQFMPTVHSLLILDHEESGPSISVGIAQPDIDPYEKWSTSETPMSKIRNLVALYDSIAENARTELVLFPETAFPFLLLQPSYEEEWRYLRRHVDSVGIPLLTGFADIRWYDSGAPPSARKLQGTGYAYETFNSSLYVRPGDPRLQIYHKSRLTPLSERIPYLDSMPFLQDVLTWGVGISNWGLGRDTTVFHSVGTAASESTWAMICYETLYPSFVSGFCVRGASFLCVITNDGWFGNTSGPYQLEAYAALRAMENRRAVARCANNGISCFIDPYGRISRETEFGTRTWIAGSIPVRTDRTFYSIHGDWLPIGCVVISLLAILSVTYSRFRKKELDQSQSV